MIDATNLPTLAEPQVSRPRLGFAGMGWIGRHRLKALAGPGLAEVVAIHDPLEDAARAAHALAPSAGRCSRFSDLLGLDLDGIVIATPSALHAEQTVAALEAGLAVFCQKPLGRDRHEVQRALAAARQADRLLGVDLSYRFTSGMKRIRDVIRRRELGPIYAVDAVFHNAYGPDKPWFYDPTLAGGGCLLDLGVHLVDLTLWCLDNTAVTEISGAIGHRQPESSGGARVEDYATAQFRVGDNTLVRLACSWRIPAAEDATIGLTFYGRDGAASFENVNGSFYDFRSVHVTGDRVRHVLTDPPEEWGGRAAVAWARQLAGSARFDPAIESLLPVATTLDRIYGRRS